MTSQEHIRKFDFNCHLVVGWSSGCVFTGLYYGPESYDLLPAWTKATGYQVSFIQNCLDLFIALDFRTTVSQVLGCHLKHLRERAEQSDDVDVFQIPSTVSIAISHNPTAFIESP